MTICVVLWSEAVRIFTQFRINMSVNIGKNPFGNKGQIIGRGKILEDLSISHLRSYY